MSFPYQIQNFDDYLEQYKISIEQPEKFWGDVAENFTWKKEMGQSAGMEFQRTPRALVRRRKIKYYRKLSGPAPGR